LAVPVSQSQLSPRAAVYVDLIVIACHTWMQYETLNNEFVQFARVVHFRQAQ
jgi:hypothetical protein